MSDLWHELKSYKSISAQLAILLQKLFWGHPNFFFEIGIENGFRIEATFVSQAN